MELHTNRSPFPPGTEDTRGPPLDEVVREMEQHPLHREIYFRPAHALVSIMEGARCRVCACLFSGPNTSSQGFYCGGWYCAQFPRDPTFTSFVATCVGLQDAFYDHLLENGGHLFEKLQGLTAHQEWWWVTLNVFRQACELSLDILGPRWRELLAQHYGSDVGRVIKGIQEMRIIPSEYYKYKHCSFIVELKNGTEYVFDPTGVQFGPEWSLLSPYDNYMGRVRSSTGTWQQVQRLGANAERSRRSRSDGHHRHKH